jgi:hypothetical protein
MTGPDPHLPPPSARGLVAWSLAAVAFPAGLVWWLSGQVPPDPLPDLPWPAVGWQAADALPELPEVRTRRGLQAGVERLARSGEGRSPGYDLRIAAGASAAELLDGEGRVVHRWQAERDRFGVPGGPNPQFGAFRAARVAPDGGLYVLVEGVGLVALDRSGALAWKAVPMAHDHLEVLPSGHLRVLASVPTQIPELVRIRVYGVDHVVELTPAGEEVGRIDLLRVYRGSAVDWHVGEDVASPFDAVWFETGADGSVAVALRQREAIAVIGPDGLTLSREERGPWKRLAAFATLPDGGRLALDHGRDDSALLRLGPDGAEQSRHALGLRFDRVAPGAVQLLPDGHAVVAAGAVRELDAAGAVVFAVDSPDTPPVALVQHLRLPPDCCAWLGEGE